MKVRYLAGGGALLAAAVIAMAGAEALGRAPAVRSTTGPAASITVTGQAQVAIADLDATLSVGVNRVGVTAGAALGSDNVVMQRVIAALEAKGLPRSDLQTSNLSVNPNYSQQNNTPGPGKIIGFDADDTLNVTVAEIADVGPLIDAAMAAGANEVNGLTFNPEHPDAVQNEALAAAMVDARSQAEALAAASHLTLGPPTDETTQVQAPQPVFAANALAAAPAEAAPTPVLSGDQYESAQVTVTFAARPD